MAKSAKDFAFSNEVLLKTMLGELPAGFSAAYDDALRKRIIIKHEEAGFCSIDLISRELRAGITTIGKPLAFPRPSGRGWQRKLVDGAIGHLSGTPTAKRASSAERSEKRAKAIAGGDAFITALTAHCADAVTSKRELVFEWKTDDTVKLSTILNRGGRRIGFSCEIDLRKRQIYGQTGKAIGRAMSLRPNWAPDLAKKAVAHLVKL